MVRSLQEILSPERALIFRITHLANLPWILRNGLHCSRSELLDPDFVTIGSQDLIEKRRSKEVPIPPGGTLDEYVPFYFTPCTPMLYNIRTGYAGIRRRANEEILILVSSLDALDASGESYVFTDRHAYLKAARFYAERADLRHVDFDLLQRRDFQRDPEDPRKVERYQAEVLVHRHVPIGALLGVACYTGRVKEGIESMMARTGPRLEVVVRPAWYFG